jgi:hypothetical protein
MHLKVGIQSRVFIKNSAQYLIEFFKLFRFLDKKLSQSLLILYPVLRNEIFNFFNFHKTY